MKLIRYFQKFIEDKLFKDNYFINEETIKEFKILVLKNGVEKIEKKFYLYFQNRDDLKISFLLIFFYLMINWAKIKQIKSIYDYLKINKVINLREDRDYFEDKAENHIFYFNKMFFEYLMQHMNSVEIVFHLKKCTNISKLSNFIMQKKIGFEVFHYFLKKISSSLRLLNILWKLLNDQKAVETYEYIIEVVSNQIFLEYTLIKDNIKIFIDELNQNSEQNWLIGFLYLYSDFLWKNKKIMELYDNFGWFYKRKYIKMPILVNLDDEVISMLNESSIQFSEEVNTQRKLIEYMDEVKLIALTKEAFNLLLANEMPDIDENLLFSQHTMLNKFGDEPQKNIQLTSMVINRKQNFIKSKKDQFEKTEESKIKE